MNRTTAHLRRRREFGNESAAFDTGFTKGLASASGEIKTRFSEVEERNVNLARSLAEEGKKRLVAT